MIDPEKSRAVAQTIRAKNKDCYWNAIQALSRLAPDDGVYVEGWCAGPIIAAQHGWVELSDGTIVDPTPTYHEEPEGHKYFPGRRYTLVEALKWPGSRLPLDPDFRLGCVPKDLFRVYTSAWAWIGKQPGKRDRRCLMGKKQREQEEGEMTMDAAGDDDRATGDVPVPFTFEGVRYLIGNNTGGVASVGEGRCQVLRRSLQLANQLTPNLLRALPGRVLIVPWIARLSTRKQGTARSLWN